MDRNPNGFPLRALHIPKYSLGTLVKLEPGVGPAQRYGSPQLQALYTHEDLHVKTEQELPPLDWSVEIPKNTQTHQATQRVVDSIISYPVETTPVKSGSINFGPNTFGPINFIDHFGQQYQAIPISRSPEPSIAITPFESDFILYLALHSTPTTSSASSFAVQLNQLRRPQYPPYKSTLRDLVEAYLKYSTTSAIINIVPLDQANDEDNARACAGELVEKLLCLGRNQDWHKYIKNLKELSRLAERREERRQSARERLLLKKFRWNGTVGPKQSKRKLQIALEKEMIREREKKLDVVGGGDVNSDTSSGEDMEIEKRIVLIERAVEIWRSGSLYVASREEVAGATTRLEPGAQ